MSTRTTSHVLRGLAAESPSTPAGPSTPRSATWRDVHSTMRTEEYGTVKFG
ncbi:MAG TPA: hypothetical protein VNC12_04515 [Solirubrobacteraceae bacterium]|nr:hypothetical protein [Solirubrobacteraceae bacterium]